MSKFITKLRVESDGKYWKLTSPLIYESEDYGKISVPPGFKTNFASVPRIPFVYAIFGNKSHSAATLHDYLYSGFVNISRKTADDIFKDAMKSRNQSSFVRGSMWAAVRMFAVFHYKGFNKKKTREVHHD